MEQNGQSGSVLQYRDCRHGDRAQGKQIAFSYNKYGADKKLHKTSDQCASPYQMILHNQRYYLIACNEKWKNLGHYRLDRITDIRMTDEPATPLRSLPGHENGIDYKEYATSLPYMFTDKPESIEFLAEPGHCRPGRRLVRRERAHTIVRR